MKRIALFYFALAFIVGSCSKYPTDSGNRDLLESESVWQYLSAYSFWQANVPKTAFTYDLPQMMLDAVHDTLRGNSYTRYVNSSSHSLLMHSADTGSTVIWEGISDSTAWVRISEFSEDISTFDSFYSILPNLQKFSNIIIDLIDNTGGGIAATDSIINCILPLHTPYIMETYRNYDDKTRTAATVPWDTIKTTRGQDPFLANKRYALLINGYSASASEILIAALKDGFSGAPHGDTAVIIGETSYGKGIGQVEITRSVYKRRDLLITFMRMKGISPRVGDYFRKGIKPDVLVSTPPGEIDHTTQITAALKILEPSAPKIRAGLYKRVGSPSRFRAEASIVATPENVPQ